MRYKLREEQKQAILANLDKTYKEISKIAFCCRTAISEFLNEQQMTYKHLGVKKYRRRIPKKEEVANISRPEATYSNQK